jgi:poly(3-hydroxyoctanoate) depolymerase
MSRHRQSDWRGDYAQAFPKAAPWIMSAHADHSADLRRMLAPTLLIWGDSDPISPLSAGQELAGLFPNARLHVIAGGTHDLARERTAELTPMIAEHIETVSNG